MSRHSNLEKTRIPRGATVVTFLNLFCLLSIFNVHLHVNSQEVEANNATKVSESATVLALPSNSSIIPIPVLHPPLIFSPEDLLLKVGENASVVLSSTPTFNSTFANETEVNLVLKPSQSGVIETLPSSITILSATQSTFNNATVFIRALAPGRVTVVSQLDFGSANITSSSIFLRVSAYKYAVLIIISEVVGWLYFVAWSISFYPQIYQNWRRKSVRGLSLDFVFLNWTGFFVYGMYNTGLYAIPSIQEEYFTRYPTSLIPVQLNDLVFTLHAILACSIACFQCIVYDKGAQTISRPGKTILMSVVAVIFILFVVTVSRAILWLDFLTACSTIKLLITLIKYVPQAILNYTRKSTSGWCIGNILLDFTGGVLSVLQMILLAFNNNDWISLFGDYTKFGLGIFSILFDIFFIVQHYFLYRGNVYNVDTDTLTEPTRSHDAYEPIEGTTVLPPIVENEDITTSNHLHGSDDEDEVASTANGY